MTVGMEIETAIPWKQFMPEESNYVNAQSYGLGSYLAVLKSCELCAMSQICVGDHLVPGTRKNQGIQHAKQTLCFVVSSVPVT